MASVFYEKLKAAAEANGLTDSQISDATKEQAAVYMDVDVSHVDDAALAVAKSKLLREYDRKKWQDALDGLKAQLTGGGRVWLRDNFPDAEFAVDHRRKTVTIFFAGRPSEGDQS